MNINSFDKACKKIAPPRRSLERENSIIDTDGSPVDLNTGRFEAAFYSID